MELTTLKMDGLFHYNESLHQWERLERVQEYKGVKILTIRTHCDYYDPKDIKNHREYRVIYPSGKTTDYFINKRELGNIKDIKECIDLKIKYSKPM